jgi:hypothetical protein
MRKWLWFMIGWKVRVGSRFLTICSTGDNGHFELYCTR